MGKKFDFQFLILGGGVAGSTLAIILAKNKKKVAIVGDKISEKTAQKFAENKITVIYGLGYFKDQNTVTVSDKNYTAQTIIIATGRRMKPQLIEGILETKFSTVDDILKEKTTPRTALIIGGGADGCRAAEHLAKNGSKVILIEKTANLIPEEEPEVSAVFHEYLRKELGITVLLGIEVGQVVYDKNGIFEATFTINGAERKVKINTVVLAIDKKPVVDLELKNAGIKYNENGVKVDDFMRTNVKNIYAIGGVTGGHDSRECANYTGIILGKNLVTSGKNLFNYNGFMRTSKTYPEMAAIGALENNLKVRKIKYQKAFIPLSETEASEIENFKYGFVKILTGKQGKILGATIVAPDAENMIQELALTMRQQLSIGQIAGTPHPLDGFSAAIKMAAKQLELKK